MRFRLFRYKRSLGHCLLRRASVQDIVGKRRGAQDSNRGQYDAKRAPIAPSQSIAQQECNPGTQNPARRSNSE
jgi:hypothetical protein